MENKDVNEIKKELETIKKDMMEGDIMGEILQSLKQIQGALSELSQKLLAEEPVEEAKAEEKPIEEKKEASITEKEIETIIEKKLKTIGINKLDSTRPEITEKSQYDAEDASDEIYLVAKGKKDININDIRRMELKRTDEVMKQIFG